MITSIVVACILSIGERKNGSSKKDIIKMIAKDRNVNKNEVYQKFI